MPSTYPELPIARGLERLFEGAREVAGVVDQRVAVAVRHAEVVRKLVRADVVAAPDLRGVHPQLARQTVDDAVHREHRLGPAGASVRRVRRLVRHHRPYVDLHVPDAMRTDEMGHRVVREHDAPDVVGAEVEPDPVADAEDRAVARGRERDRVDLMARVRGAGHVLAPALDPLHGPAERHRRDGDQRVLGVPRRLRAEATAEVGGDHTDLVGWQTERAGEPLLDEVRDLRT